MKIYSGMWIAYKKAIEGIETAYRPLFFTEVNDNAAIGFLLNDAMLLCPKEYGWYNHNANATEVKLTDIMNALDVIEERIEQ